MILNSAYQIKKYGLFILSWINNLSKQNRILSLFGLLLLIYLVWYFGFYGPFNKKSEAVKAQIVKLNSKIADLQQKSSIIIVEANKPPDEKLQTQYDKLKEENEKLTKQLAVLNEDLIPPEKMADVLREILGKENALELVELKSSPAQSLFDVHTDQQKTLVKDRLYSQSMTLIFKGDYRHTFDYLKKAEKLKWRIFWDQLYYNVLKYPEAEVTIQVHTLSRK